MEKAKIILIILIFLLLTSFSISSWLVEKRYQTASGINLQIEELMNMTKDNEIIYSKLQDINRELEFVNAVCFKNRPLQ